MIISGANQPALIKAEYLSSGGNRKTLVFHDDGSKKVEAVELLSALKCQICHIVHERTLQTRCCETVLCASCYLSFWPPKICPHDGVKLKGSIQKDLKLAGRLIDEQIKKLIENFSDIKSVETDIDKEKSNHQSNAVKQLTPVSQSTSGQSARQNVREINVGGSRLDENFATINIPNINYVSFGSGNTVRSHNMPPGSGITVHEIGSTIVREISGDNLVISNGRVVSGNNIKTTTHHIDQAIQRNPVRTYDFNMDDVGFIDVDSRCGDILIEEQDCEKQDKVSVTLSKQPKLNCGALSIDSNESVVVKVPTSFSKYLKLHSATGSILTGDGCCIRTGGIIHANCGSVAIRVDSQLVEVKGKSNLGSVNIKVRNHDAKLARRCLEVKSNINNVSVFDVVDP